ncbi:MAG: Rieske (2Fe-2S) protein [Balneolaceae bacterium]|nr:Rieske (2Fe-2S) protein [Balneolaceae bacterium]
MIETETDLEKKEISRSDFLKTAGSTALFAFLGIAYTGCTNRVTDSAIDSVEGDAVRIDGNQVIMNLDHPDLEDLNREGGWRLIAPAEVLVVNVGNNKIRAFTSVCTHAQCSTSWDFREGEFICGCHLSRFNTGGEVTRGPATTDLQEFDVLRNGQNVVIIKEDAS